MMNPFTALKNLINLPIDALGRLAKSFNPYVPEELMRDGMEPVRIEESSIKKQSGKLIGITFIAFLAWAFTAPIDSGTVVQGSVVVQGSRKAVQHPQGGVVNKILVKEGDKVKAGDIVLQINPLNIDANLRQAEYEFIQTLAANSRLLAERAEQRGISWDRDLNDFAKHPQVAEAKRLQTALFLSRQREINAAESIFSQKSEGIRQQLAEKQRILSLRSTLVKPIEQDAQSVRRLADGGFVPRTRANEAERSAVEAQAGIIALQAEITNLGTELSNIQLELNKSQAAFQRATDAELSEVQKRKETLRASVQSLRFDQSLTNLRAPASGTIVGLKAHTEGGVISGGQILMEIVPDDEKLIVEAAVPPHLIDKVSVGLTTDMRFSAFNKITTPVIPGVIRLVGADRLPPDPPKFIEEYFLIQVETTPESLVLLGQHQIVAGMPVEVIVKGGERSFMSYMLKPLFDRFARSFKE
jgi:protease secretion system membrane fusion protein